MKKIDFPVLNVQMISTSKVIANDYNPNKVAYPEMKLLKHSIEQDGYTQPIVTYYDKKKDIYVIVDGFHRYRCAKEYFHLEEIPVVVIKKDIKNRMASTIRHNRARGTHQIKDMSIIVKDLAEFGWSDEKICNELGMELDEVIRLKQVSKSWDEFEKRYYSDQIKNND